MRRKYSAGLSPGSINAAMRAYGTGEWGPWGKYTADSGNIVWTRKRLPPAEPPPEQVRLFNLEVGAERRVLASYSARSVRRRVKVLAGDDK